MNFFFSQTCSSCWSLECPEVKAEGKDSQCVNVWKLLFDFCSYTSTSGGECFKRVSERYVMRLHNVVITNNFSRVAFDKK